MTELDESYPLDPTALRSFDEHGFVRLPNVLSAATIATYEPEMTAAVIELNTQHLPLDERDTYGRAFLQVMNLWRHSETVERFVMSRRLARIAAELLGTDGVRLYHDQALYKEAGGGITPWHADQYYWPLETDRCVTAWIPLQPTPMEMGPLAFATGSHRFSIGRDLAIGDESEAQIAQAMNTSDFVTVEEPFDVGEVSFHRGWTFHRAGANHSPVPRRVMTIIYIDADITVAEPTNDNQRNDLASWMPGTAVGDTPTSELNPVLYRRV